MQAFGDGETIQTKDENFGWMDLANEKGEPCLNKFLTDTEYRIKPKPREFYVCKKIGYNTRVLTSEEFCNSSVDFVNLDWEIINVVQKDFCPYK